MLSFVRSWALLLSFIFVSTPASASCNEAIEKLLLTISSRPSKFEALRIAGIHSKEFKDRTYQFNASGELKKKSNTLTTHKGDTIAVYGSPYRQGEKTMVDVFWPKRNKETLESISLETLLKLCKEPFLNTLGTKGYRYDRDASKDHHTLTPIEIEKKQNGYEISFDGKKEIVTDVELFLWNAFLPEHDVALMNKLRSVSQLRGEWILIETSDLSKLNTNGIYFLVTEPILTPVKDSGMKLLEDADTVAQLNEQIAKGYPIVFTSHLDKRQVGEVVTPDHSLHKKIMGEKRKAPFMILTTKADVWTVIHETQHMIDVSRGLTLKLQALLEQIKTNTGAQALSNHEILEIVVFILEQRAYQTELESFIESIDPTHSTPEAHFTAKVMIAAHQTQPLEESYAPAVNAILGRLQPVSFEAYLGVIETLSHYCLPSDFLSPRQLLPDHF